MGMLRSNRSGEEGYHLFTADIEGMKTQLQSLELSPFHPCDGFLQY